MQEKLDNTTTTQPVFTVSIQKTHSDEGYLTVGYNIPVPVNDKDVLQKKPIDYIFCIDISGSMNYAAKKGEPTKIELVKTAISQFIRNNLEKDSQDTISIISFDSTARQIISKVTPQYFGEHEKDLLSKLKPQGATFIQSAFEALSTTDFGPENSTNKAVLILATDGKDENRLNITSKESTRYSDPERIETLFRERCGQEAELCALGIGEGYIPATLAAILKRSHSPQEDVAHIDAAADTQTAIANLANYGTNSRAAELTITVAIGGFEKTFTNLNITYGEDSGLPPIRFKLSDLMAKGEKEAAYPNDISLSFEYGKHREAKDMHGEIQLPIQYLEPPTSQSKLTSDPDSPSFPEITMGSLLMCEIMYRYHEIMKDEDVGVLNTITSLNLTKALGGEKKNKIVRFFNELIELKERLVKEETATHSAQYHQIMNSLNDLLRVFATHLRFALMLSGNKTGAMTAGTVTNARVNQANSTAKSLHAQIYQPGERTGQVQQQLKGIAQGHYKQIDGLDFLTIQDRASEKPIVYVNISSGLDLVALSRQRQRQRHRHRQKQNKWSYLDGKANREILVVDNDDRNMAYCINDDIALKTSTEDGLSQLLRMTNKLFPDVKSDKTDTGQDRFNIAIYDNADSLPLANGGELLVVKLENFYNLAIGCCRQRALFIASQLTNFITDPHHKGLMPEGSVRLVRSTAYNQNAHAFVVYGTENKLLLLDPLLGEEPFNIKDREILLKVVKLYNDKALPGILLKLIADEALPMEPDGEDSKLFDLPLLDPAFIESLGLDSMQAFEDQLCPIGLQIPSDPVRVIFENGNLSPNVYNREEIEDWFTRNNTDPATRQKIARIPDFNDPISQQCRRDLYKLIQTHCGCVKPEELGGSDIERTEESIARKEQREANALAKSMKSAMPQDKCPQKIPPDQIFVNIFPPEPLRCPLTFKSNPKNQKDDEKPILAGNTSFNNFARIQARDLIPGSLRNDINKLITGYIKSRAKDATGNELTFISNHFRNKKLTGEKVELMKSFQHQLAESCTLTQLKGFVSKLIEANEKQEREYEKSYSCVTSSGLERTADAIVQLIDDSEMETNNALESNRKMIK